MADLNKLPEIDEISGSRHGGPDSGTPSFLPPDTPVWEFTARKFAETGSTLSTNKPGKLVLDFWGDWRMSFLGLKEHGMDRISAKEFHRLEVVDSRIEVLKVVEENLWKSTNGGSALDPVQLRLECQNRIRLETEKQNTLLTAILNLKRSELSFLTGRHIPEGHPFLELSQMLKNHPQISPELCSSMLARAQQRYDEAKERKAQEQQYLEKLDELHRLQKERVEILERLSRRYDILQGRKPLVPRRVRGNTPHSQTTDRMIWGVFVGINQYKRLLGLNGAVRDAEAMKDFFETHFETPSDNLKILTNEEATRDAILSTLYSHIRDNEEIKHNHAIVVYFAGHGTSYDATEAFPDTPASIEAICPVNRGCVENGRKVLDISDREINLFLSEVCALKGNNITFIMDCCFSGGTTRHAAPDMQDTLEDTTLARVAPPMEQALKDMLNAAELNPLKRWAAGSALTESWNPDMTSHVVVAACQDYEKAWETSAGRGAFTTALLDSLQSLDLSETTYRSLISHIGRLARQTPLAAGSRLDSVLFCP